MNKSIVRVLVSVTVAVVLGTLAYVRPWTPSLPFSCAFRPAHFGHALVAQIHNNSNTVHKVLISIESPTTQQMLRKLEILGPGGVAEIGWLEGWSFVSGEKLRVHEAGFRDLDVSVP